VSRCLRPCSVVWDWNPGLIPSRIISLIYIDFDQLKWILVYFGTTERALIWCSTHVGWNDIERLTYLRQLLHECMLQPTLRTGTYLSRNKSPGDGQHLQHIGWSWISHGLLAEKKIKNQKKKENKWTHNKIHLWSAGVTWWLPVKQTSEEIRGSRHEGILSDWLSGSPWPKFNIPKHAFGLASPRLYCQCTTGDKCSHMTR
jgi:hypothetical protein